MRRIPTEKLPRRTVPVVAGLQGFGDTWWLSGRKTAQYLQIGNAFPPPVAAAVACSIIRAFEHAGQPREMPELASATMHDPVYRVLKEAEGYLTPSDLLSRLPTVYDVIQLERRFAHLSKDFILELRETPAGIAYTLGVQGLYRIGRTAAWVGVDSPCSVLRWRAATERFRGVRYKPPRATNQRRRNAT